MRGDGYVAETVTDTSAHGDKDHMRGLNSEEVAERIAAGLVNVDATARTQTVGQIVRRNTLTFFNGVNLVMLILVLMTGQFRNLLFLIVVLANLLIGIVQELHAKRMVDRLSIITATDCRVIRADGETSIPISQIVQDDLVRIGRGDQVPADGTVVSGVAALNESLLTGESNAIEKNPGDEVMSGSFVDSGSITYRVTHVGRDGYAARISEKAKAYKAIRSEIRLTINAIIKVGTTILVPLGIGLFTSTMIHGHTSVNQALLQAVAAVGGMIPQGLVLLTSTVLAIATVRLAGEKVLVQQVYCIEALARVDVLCLDKTGTITTGAMEVVEVRGEDVRGAERAISTIAVATRGEANETSRAICTYAEAHDLKADACSRVIPFSSRYKYSGCVTEDGRAYVMGATQFVLGTERASREAQGLPFERLMRVLVVATCDGFDEEGHIVGEPQTLGFVAIRDQIRPTAAPTISYFGKQGVGVRVISGDDPATASAIARQVGIPNAERYVDASTLESEDDLLWAVAHDTVFGRVTPDMKRRLVRALGEQGHTVAMTGDGVNDILAFREADCSIAMASGSAAARNIAEIVLADSDFSHLPNVVAEGRRSINNLQRSAALFLMKTVYTAALTFVCIVVPPYPFIPIQMSLISTAIIGVPSFILALEPNYDRISGNFLTNVLARSLPASVTTVFSIILLMVVSHFLGWSANQYSTMCMSIMCLVGMALLLRISLPLNTLRGTLLVGVLSIILLGIFVFSDFFGVTPFTQNMTAAFCLVALIALAMFSACNRYLQGSERSDLMDRIVREIWRYGTRR